MKKIGNKVLTIITSIGGKILTFQGHPVFFIQIVKMPFLNFML